MQRRAGDCLADIDVIVLAGGLGTRLRAAVPDSPKVLAPVAGRAFLDLLLDWLAEFGARRIVLSLGYKAEAVTDHLARTPRPGLDIVPVIETEPLGTGGALRLASDSCRSAPILVVNGDTLVSADLCAFLAAHRRVGAAITLMCAEVADAHRYGRLVVADDRIQTFVEKDPHFAGAATVSAGVYLFEPAAVAAIPAGRSLSLESEVLARLPAGSVAAWGEGVRFLDIGTPESFLDANEAVSRGVYRARREW